MKHNILSHVTVLFKRMCVVSFFLINLRISCENINQLNVRSRVFISSCAEKVFPIVHNADSENFFIRVPFGICDRFISEKFY